MNNKFLIDNENVIRAIHLARLGRFGVCVLFQDNVSIAQRNQVNHFVGRHCHLTSLGKCHIAVEYITPDSYSYFNNREPNVDHLNCNHISLGLISDDLDKGCRDLLQTAYDRLGYEPQDVEKIMVVAKCAAFAGGSKKIRIEDLAEAIHYRSFDRELLIQSEVSWTADQVLEIFGSMSWTDWTAKKWLSFENSDELSPEQEIKYEAIMWGWQGAVDALREKFGIDSKGIILPSAEHSPSTRGWYLCQVNNEIMPLCYNLPNNFWIGIDGQIYQPENVLWKNNQF